jgi:G3E family GTPase
LAKAAVALPFTVIGGFLGAGKTTLLRRLLAAGERRWAVLVNDFGALNIDAALIAGQEGRTVRLTNGCACCSLGPGLLDGVGDLLDSGLTFDAMVVEASGVADPWRIAELALVERRLRLEAVLVLADAVRLPALLADRYVAETVANQLRVADLVLLNKRDLAGAAGLAAARAAAEALRPGLRLLATEQAALPPELLDLPPPARFRASAPAAHEAVFRRFAYRRAGAFDRGALERALAEMPPALLRLKGFVQAPDPLLLQMVGARWALTPAPEAAPGIALAGIGTPELPEESALAARLDAALIAG